MPLQATTVVGSGDDVDSLYFNPFASPPPSRTSFSSAFTKDARTGGGPKPTLRRRGSDGSGRRSRTDHDPWTEDAAGSSSSAHVRARTVDTVVGSSSGTNLRHPLAVSSLGGTATSSRSSLADTRPRLKRILSDLETAPARKAGDGDGGEELVSSPTASAGPSERVVIVHEVSPKDSLPGVSLKYGISLADLRRANQLWPSDPIHLRKILYIPLDKSTKGKELYLSHIEAQSAETSEATSPVNADSKPNTNNAGTSLTIRRIPAAQLSFFPPSSSSSLSPAATASTIPRSAGASRKRDLLSFDDAPPNPSPLSMTASLSISSTALPSTLAVPSMNDGPGSGRTQIPSLSSIFSSLPIGRISFDSSTSTPSAISDDQEHELRDVSHRSSLDDGRDRRPDRQHAAPVRASPKSKPAVQHDAAVELHPYSPLSPGPYAQTPGYGGLRSAPTTPSKRPPPPSHHSAYVSPERPSPTEVVRTSQMEPSPVMQLPLKPRKERMGDPYDRVER